MPFKAAGKELMLDELAALITHVALYTDDAATTEVTGGSPAYARKAITWGSASGDSVAASNAPAFDVPGSTTVKAVGFMSAVSGGTQYAFHNLTDEAFAGQGTYTLTAATLTLNDPA